MRKTKALEALAILAVVTSIGTLIGGITETSITKFVLCMFVAIILTVARQIHVEQMRGEFTHCLTGLVKVTLQKEGEHLDAFQVTRRGAKVKVTFTAIAAVTSEDLRSQIVELVNNSDVDISVKVINK